MLQKILQNIPSYYFLNFLCLTSKFLVFKLLDLKCRKILYNLNAEDEGRLSPFEDDKLKG